MTFGKQESYNTDKKFPKKCEKLQQWNFNKTSKALYLDNSHQNNSKFEQLEES